ncbi:MAG TPA: hypothetical protein DCF88_05745 [Plesiomonas shigelloides]|nr:hypothetical protein [Plesiomonas shigelloides]
MLRKTLLTCALFMCSATVFAETAPLSVSYQGTYLKVRDNVTFPVWQLTVTSLDNDITIESLTLNRDNCLISINGRGKNMSKRLKYGQTFSFTTPSNRGFTQCRPLELTVGTNKGPFTFNWS